MKLYKNKSLLAVLSAAILLVSCDKTKPYDTITPPAQAHFLNATSGSYYVKNDPNSVFKIPVGTTLNSASNRTVTVTVASPTNAVAGTQYTLPSTSVVIPAGKVVDSLSVKGIFAGYPGQRVDTLVFTINNGDVPASDYNKTYKLVLRKYCDVLPASFTGNYTQSYDIDPTVYGPYTSNIVSVTPLTATTASMVIANFSFEEITPYPINNITVNLDWTDPANFKTSIPSQIISSSNFYGYGALTIAPNGTGTFSSCDNTFTFNYKLTVSAGSFGNFVTKMAR